MKLSLERVIRFVVVADEMSFTKAAQQLNVDQPWLSRQIQQLEEHLGFSLFERTTRRISLTDEGAVFLEQAKRVAAEAAELNRLADTLGRRYREELRLGCITATYWLPARSRLVELFDKRYPRMTLTVSAGASPLLLTQLKQQQIDLALIAPVEDMRDFDFQRVFSRRPGLLIPQEHPLANKPELKMADLAGIKLAAAAHRWNHYSFNRLYQPFFDAGMIDRPVEEGKLAVNYYVRAERLFMLVFQKPFMSSVSDDFVYRDVVDTTSTIEFGLARLKDDDRLMVRRLWSLAAEIGDGGTAPAEEVELQGAA